MLRKQNIFKNKIFGTEFLCNFQKFSATHRLTLTLILFFLNVSWKVENFKNSYRFTGNSWFFISSAGKNFFLQNFCPFSDFPSKIHEPFKYPSYKKWLGLISAYPPSTSATWSSWNSESSIGCSWRWKVLEKDTHLFF